MKAEVEECFKSIIRERTARLKSEENVIHLEQTVGGYSGFLFIDDNGLPLVAMHWEHRLHNMVNRYNQIYKVQMPKITPHVCRHTYCSNMARKGMNPKTLQYLMGHSDISVTLNVYTHLGLQDAVEEMTRLQDLERAREEQERMDGENSAADDEGSSMVI
jgi:site-specific recombinase XerD